MLLFKAFGNATDIVHVELPRLAPKMNTVAIPWKPNANRCLSEHLSTSRIEEDGSRSVQKIPPVAALGDITAIEVNVGIYGRNTAPLSPHLSAPPGSRNIVSAHIDAAWNAVRGEQDTEIGRASCRERV